MAGTLEVQTKKLIRESEETMLGEQNELGPQKSPQTTLLSL